jgi:hypothetical protein
LKVIRHPYFYLHSSDESQRAPSGLPVSTTWVDVPELGYDPSIVVSSFYSTTVLSRQLSAAAKNLA